MNEIIETIKSMSLGEFAAASTGSVIVCIATLLAVLSLCWSSIKALAKVFKYVIAFGVFTAVGIMASEDKPIEENVSNAPRAIIVDEDPPLFD